MVIINLGHIYIYNHDCFDWWIRFNLVSEINFDLHGILMLNFVGRFVVNFKHKMCFIKYFAAHSAYIYVCVLYVPKMFSQLVLFWNIYCKNHLMHYSFCVKHHFTVCWCICVCEYVIVIMLFELKWYKFTFLYTLQMLTNICFTVRNFGPKNVYIHFCRLSLICRNKQKCKFENNKHYYALKMKEQQECQKNIKCKSSGIFPKCQLSLKWK